MSKNHERMLCFVAQDANSREGNCTKSKTLHPYLDRIAWDLCRSQFYFKVGFKQSSCLSEDELDKTLFLALPLFTNAHLDALRQ